MQTLRLLDAELDNASASAYAPAYGGSTEFGDAPTTQKDQEEGEKKNVVVVEEEEHAKEASANQETPSVSSPVRLTSYQSTGCVYYYYSQLLITMPPFDAVTQRKADLWTACAAQSSSAQVPAPVARPLLHGIPQCILNCVVQHI